MTDGLNDAIARLNAVVPDATRGLPESVFYLVSRLTPLVNVDLLVKNEAKQTLLTWRADRYYGPGWHIPGGIVRFKERWENRIAAVAAHELGTTVSFDETPISIKQLFAADRAIRGHFISLLFACRLMGPLKEELEFRGGEPRNGQWSWHSKCPEEMIRQHKIYKDFI
jgi:ADP-ribose pyrophosphatase YjhB (NUDIX family)